MGTYEKNIRVNAESAHQLTKSPVSYILSRMLGGRFMKKILIIDDSQFMRFNLSNFLKQNDYEIFEAENGVAGIEAVQKHHPDCIISDLLMPEMDGYSFLEHLNNKNIKIPVIIITADVQATTKKKITQAGAVGLINKPPKYPDLLKLIESSIKKTGNLK
jgi:CheY-like chemotaxis protein